MSSAYLEGVSTHYRWVDTPLLPQPVADCSATGTSLGSLAAKTLGICKSGWGR